MGLGRTSGWPEPGRPGRRMELQMGRAERLNSSLVGSPHSSLHLGLHLHFGHSAHGLLHGCWQRAALVWWVGQKDTSLDRKSTEVGELTLWESWWGSAGSSASFTLRDGGFFDVSSPFMDTACTHSWRHWKSWQLLWFSLHWEQSETVFLHGCFMRSGKRAPGQSTRINFTNVSPSDKVLELCQFLYVLSHWLRTALSWIGKREQCKSTDVWHLPVFWLREREINKSCQRNALE